MNLSLRPNHPTAAALREQAAAIYNAMLTGTTGIATAMLHQVPKDRLPYVVFTMTVLALHEGKQYDLSRMLESEVH
jgi:hypothetical protein